MAGFLKLFTDVPDTPKKLILQVVLYTFFLIMICICFSGGGGFIYEAF